MWLALQKGTVHALWVSAPKHYYVLLPLVQWLYQSEMAASGPDS